MLHQRQMIQLLRDFLGGPVVQTSASYAGDAGLIPGGRIKDSRAQQSKKKKKKQTIKQKQYCNKFNKDFKKCPHQKSLKKQNKSYP